MHCNVARTIQTDRQMETGGVRTGVRWHREKRGENEGRGAREWRETRSALRGTISEQLQLKTGDCIFPIGDISREMDPSGFVPLYGDRTYAETHEWYQWQK